MEPSVSTRSLKKNLGVSKGLPTKRRARASIENSPVEDRPVPRSPEDAFNHGMQLRPRSRTGSVIKVSPEDTPSSERMVLRPKRKSPEKPSPASLPAKKSPVDGPIPRLYQGSDPEEMKRNTEERSEWLKRVSQQMHLVKERTVSPKGFTQRELSMCRSYMLKQDFELKGPIPKKKKFFKDFLDQVRASPYGVTVDYPGGPIGSSFKPFKRELENGDPKVAGYVEDMTEKLFGAIRRKRKEAYRSLGADNLVRVRWFYFLLTLRVQLRNDLTAEPRVVEALFYQKPGTSVVNPKLLEWKIKQGSVVEFCTDQCLV